MRRLRLALLLLGLALAVPVMLLVGRAREGERLEHEMRHQVVAARAFDEMERRLTSVLEQEEARPFESYRALVGEGSGAPGDVPDFVIGHFQIDPDGRLHATPGTDVGVVARTTLGADSGARRGAPPATTRVRRARERSGYDTAKDSLTSGEDVYEVLSRLNLGRKSRAERKQQVRQEPLSKLYGDAAETVAKKKAAAALPRQDAPAPSLLEAQAAAPRDAAEGDRDAGEGRSSGFFRELDTVEAEDELLDLRAAEPPAFAFNEVSIRVALDPMVGRPVDGGRLLLYRTALVGELGYRQGALLDRRALGSWLEGQVLAPQGLGGLAVLRFDMPRTRGAVWAPADHLVFEHRFAEPFDAMSAQLALAPLPGRGASSAVSIYALAGLLVLVATGGLLAVDRMVKVVVSFAERRSRFVASVSHELKTPLTAIRMYAEMLRDGLVQDEAKRDEYYSTITDESERLSRLIDNVLEFSRLERGQREIELAVGAVPAVLDEAASKLRPHAERQGFALRVVADSGLSAVRFDRDALLQVLFNLVDNAMKYARPASPAEIVLEARADGERVMVGVRDFGPGVDQRHLTRIFEPFYRAEAELTRSAKGTGIGLALVKELGQAMGASVSGANVEGGGFRVMLAFAPAT